MKPLSEILNAVEFTGIRLTTLEAQVLKGKQGSSELSVRTGVSSAPELVEKENGKLLSVACIIEVGADPGEQENAAMRFKCVYQLIYAVRDSSLVLEDFKEFLEKNVMFNAWPYFRELLLSTSVRMECNPIYLPLFKLNNLKPEKKTSAQEQGEKASD